MTERTQAARHAEDLDRPDSPNALIWFLTIEHPALNPPIRVVSDYFDYVIDGDTYQMSPFEVTPLSDNEQSPSASLRIPNIDRRVAAALENEVSGERAIVSAVAYSSADFDLNEDPRAPLDSNDLPAIYSFQYFELTDVSGDVLEITGRITILDVTQEPWPYLRATQDRFPGLFA